ncbi:hypothetical protein [Streptomyces cyaneofuscatus]|uniref:hypothetical protein n=1 Tax=Streptomyces cyaneofuscatus TaxID=66883 RepID=UPI003665EE48
MFKHRPTTGEIGQTAYEAYAKAVDNRSVNGDELPEWDKLTAPVRNAWQLSAEAVRHKVELSTT